jgi:hypothetical protein
MIHLAKAKMVQVGVPDVDADARWPELELMFSGSGHLILQMMLIQKVLFAN